MNARDARWGRLRAFFWRFHTLRLADRLFAGVPAPCVLERPLFGRTMTVDVSRSNAQRLLWLEGERFVGERHLVSRLLAPGMRVADVGANIGYYMLLAASRVGSTGRVACFEPEPDNLVELERNVRVNHLENVEVFPVAVGAEDGTASLNPGMNGTVAADGVISVPLRRLDSVLDRIDFLKVDVEGYEGHVLAGARELLATHRPTLFVEIHPGFLAPPHTVDDILGMIREVRPAIEFHEIHPQTGIAGRLAARYGGRSVRRVPDAEALLADCRAGRRAEPFWAVAPR
jgi:FkbM family methyltransferase